jgi:hypothetical protein
MNRCTHRALVCGMLLAAIFSTGVRPAVARAQSTSDLVDWNLTESTSTWNTQFHISSTGDGWAAFRWLDSPNKPTVISGNACADLSLYGSASIGVSDTTYHNLFWGGGGTCFVLRGRTGSGSGSMVNHDGRVRR